MKFKLLLSATFLSASLFSTAQNALKLMRSPEKQTIIFSGPILSRLILSTGKVNKILFEADKTTFKIDNLDKAVYSKRAADNNPTGFGVAACALDTRHNRLYFATMHFSDIRYLDLYNQAQVLLRLRKMLFAKPANRRLST